MSRAPWKHTGLGRVALGLVVSTVLLATGPMPAARARPGDPEMVRVQGGAYRPFFRGRKGAPPIPVATFLLDREPITRAQFAVFLANEARWRKARVSVLFAERGYLEGWTGNRPPAAQEHAPMSNVSWFAAKAYCECEGRRLPTQAEWEWAAAGERAGASAVRFASAGHSPQGAGASGAPHFAIGHPGASGLGSGEVWEWTEDFDTPLVSNPSPDEPSSSLFCGDGFRATNARDYAGFLRFSFRSSLRASYTLRNLGFRCARTLPRGEQ